MVIGNESSIKDRLKRATQRKALKDAKLLAKLYNQSEKESPQTIDASPHIKKFSNLFTKEFPSVKCEANSVFRTPSSKIVSTGDSKDIYWYTLTNYMAKRRINRVIQIYKNVCKIDDNTYSDYKVVFL